MHLDWLSLTSCQPPTMTENVGEMVLDEPDSKGCQCIWDTAHHLMPQNSNPMALPCTKWLAHRWVANPFHALTLKSWWANHPKHHIKGTFKKTKLGVCTHVGAWSWTVALHRKKFHGVCNPSVCKPFCTRKRHSGLKSGAWDDALCLRCIGRL
jgi:hypothetical protein